MSNAKQLPAQPPSNARNPQPFVKIDVNKLIDGYTALEKALQEIANIPSTMTPQMQAYTMRAIAKKALGL